MVNVTKSNFLPQLSDFLTHLPTASYIAIDEEMTGISLPTNNSHHHHHRPDKLEPPRVKYLRMLKGVSERYSILQVGVALFHKNPYYQKENVNPVETTTSKKKMATASVHTSMDNGTDQGVNENEDEEDKEHAYMHREGTLNQDELENVTEMEEMEKNQDNILGADNNFNLDNNSENDDDIHHHHPDADITRDTDHHEQSEYISRTYNFHLFSNGGKDEREMTLKPSTVKFLLEHHMDFDKVFREGIPYTTVENASQMKKIFFKKYATFNARVEVGVNGITPSSNGEKGATQTGSKSVDNTSTSRRDRVQLSRIEDIAFVARTMAQLREWIDSDDSVVEEEAAAAATVTGRQESGARPHNGRDAPNGNNDGGQGEGTSLLLPPCNAFLRRCLYETIEDEYPGLILERADIDSNNVEAAATLRNQIRVIRLSPTEKLRRESRKKREAWDELLMEMGFTIIFQAISDACNGNVFSAQQTWQFLDGMCPELSSSMMNGGVDSDQIDILEGRKIPLVVHNGLHDLLFLLTHCHNAVLPESFEDTKQIIRSYFPLVFDTKVIGIEYSDAIIKGGSTTLGDLFDTICKDEFLPFTVPQIVNQDGRNSGQAHEASWDAYMTGCVFTALCNRILESKISSDSQYDALDKLLHNSSVGSQLREWFGLNLLHMHLSLYTIDLESQLGPEGLGDPLSSGFSFDSTFRVSGIKSSVSTRDVLQALSIGNESEDEVVRQLKYEIIWIDDSSFFVGTRMGDYTSTDDLSTTRLIASHVRNKLHGGLGKVDIMSLGEHLRKTINKPDITRSEGLVGSLASIASKPFQVIGKLLGFPDNLSSGETHLRKRKRVG